MSRLRYARYESCLKELGFGATQLTQQLSLQLHSKTLAAADTVFEAGSVAEEACGRTRHDGQDGDGHDGNGLEHEAKHFGYYIDMIIPWI